MFRSNLRSFVAAFTCLVGLAVFASSAAASVQFTSITPSIQSSLKDMPVKSQLSSRRFRLVRPRPLDDHQLRRLEFVRKVA